MSVLIDRIKLVGSKGEKKVYALYDSGASCSMIRKDLAAKLAIIDQLPEPLRFETAKENDDILITERAALNFYIDGIRLSDEFFIADDLSEEVIIGAKTMQAWRLKLDFDQERVIVDQRVTRLMLK